MSKIEIVDKVETVGEASRGNPSPELGCSATDEIVYFNLPYSSIGHPV